MSILANSRRMRGHLSIRSIIDNITEPAILISTEGNILDYNRQFQQKIPVVIDADSIDDIFALSSTNMREIRELVLKRTGLFPVQLSLRNGGDSAENAHRGVPSYLSSLRYERSKEPAAILIQFDEHLLRLTSRFKTLREEQHQYAKQARLASLEATIDELTGLKNRRFLNSFLDFQWHATKRSSEDAVLVIFDIDHFKRINDEYGHDGGDAALKAFANCLKAQARAADIVARWGGEEFVIILTNCTEDEAELFLTRTMTEIKRMTVSVAEGVIQMTASAGFVAFSRTSGVENTIARADKALYQAKNSGRNKFVKCPQSSQ